MILITGAAGYIGAHLLMKLMSAGHEVVAIDNLSTGTHSSITVAEQLAGSECVFLQGDVRDKSFLDTVFRQYPISAVIHLAGLKFPGESLSNPLSYYDNNVSGTQQLLMTMQSAGVYRLIYSSSAAVYGNAGIPPFHEDVVSLAPLTPYGQSKLVSETILSDLSKSDKRWRIGILRYFNPAGAHPSGLLGDMCNPTGGGLVDQLCRVASNKQSELAVFGNDHPTADGTGIRDYLHILDLSNGHLAALNFLQSNSGYHIWNLGSGQGHSVLEVINTFTKVTGEQISFSYHPKRAGDVSSSWTNPSKAARELNWQTEYSLEQIIRDAWNHRKVQNEDFNIHHGITDQ